MALLGGVFLHVEHCPPDRDPSATLVLKYPQIPASRSIPFAGTLVEHVISKRHNCRVTGDINLIVLLAEFMNSRVLAEIAEPGKKVFPALYASAEAGENHYDFRVHHRSKLFDFPFEPRLVDSTHSCPRIFVFGF